MGEFFWRELSKLFMFIVYVLVFVLYVCDVYVFTYVQLVFLLNKYFK